MYISRLLYSGLLILLCISCQTAENTQTASGYGPNPKVVTATKAAIIGGQKALQKKLAYPPEAKKKGVETTLHANVLINKKGKIDQISFDEESGYGFEEAARQALQKVSYRAGQRNGKPVNMFVTIPVVFKL